jgi:hypothetical protein
MTLNKIILMQELSTVVNLLMASCETSRYFIQKSLFKLLFFWGGGGIGGRVTFQEILQKWNLPVTLVLQP